MGKVALAGLLALGMGCVNADFDDEFEETTEIAPVALEAINVQFEQISWQSGIGGDDWLNKLPDQAPGVCECTGHACMEDWVDSNLGCDLCVAVRCPGVQTEHVCVSC